MSKTDEAIEALEELKQFIVEGEEGQYETIRAALEQTVPEWQPIESAPKNQRVVLIYCPREYNGNGGQHVAAYMNFTDRPGWYSHVSGIHEPSHWMPLPPAPGSTELRWEAE